MRTATSHRGPLTAVIVRLRSKSWLGWAIVVVTALEILVAGRCVAQEERFERRRREGRDRGYRPEPLGDPPTYTGMFADGKPVRDAWLVDWQQRDSQPKVGGRALFHPETPIRWLRNQSLGPGPTPQAFIEMVGGDRLAGDVTRFVSGEDVPDRKHAPYLLILPRGETTGPDGRKMEEIPVAARWLRRIVWQNRGLVQYVPGTVFYRDGRRLSFRKVRLVGERLLLLGDEGPLEVPIGDVAELHLPSSDPWQAHFEQLAVLSPRGQDRLLCFETDDGTRVTTSLARLLAASRSGSSDPRLWFHLVQPAWALRAFWVPVARVHSWRYFAAHEVPLSHLEPTRVVQLSTSGMGWPMLVDRNIRGQFLRSGNRGFGWGLGMHAHCEASYPLVDGVRTFRSQVGLDEAVYRGGCARAKVYVNSPTGKPLYHSEHLIGSTQIVDTGRLELAGPAGGQSSLVLVADSAHADRPAGADPLDIRDLVDWLEPTLELDPAVLVKALRQAWTWAVPAWEGWTVASAGGESSPLRTRWEDPYGSAPQCVMELNAGTSLVLRSTLKVEPHHNWLVLAVSHTAATIHRPQEAKLPADESAPKGDPSARDAPSKQAHPTDAKTANNGASSNELLLPSVWGPPTKIAAGAAIPQRVVVRFDGEPVAQFDVPAETYRGRVPEPLLVPVEDYRGESVRIEVEHLPAGVDSRVIWRSVALVERLSPTHWTTLVPRQMRSSEGALLMSLPDGSVIATGRKPERDLYTLTVETRMRGITAFRLEAIRDGSLPGTGPGRSTTGNFVLGEFRVTAAPVDAPHAAQPVRLARPRADYQEANFGIARAIDGSAASGWSVAGAVGASHLATFEVDTDPTLPTGTVLVFQLDQQFGAVHTLGRFRLSATTDPLPLPVERVGRIVRPPAAVDQPSARTAAALRNRLVVVDEDSNMLAALSIGKELGRVERTDRFAGGMCFRVKPGVAGAERWPKLNAPIREEPGPGEYRYLRWAWKKRGGNDIGLELIANGKRGPLSDGGPGTPLLYRVASKDKPSGIVVHAPPLDHWIVVTRDLYADFGAFDLTGVAFHCPDGEGALFDRVVLARSMEDFSRSGP